MHVDFSLLDTDALNQRNMRGPDQYHGDALQRANEYLDRINHQRLLALATQLAATESV